MIDQEFFEEVRDELTIAIDIAWRHDELRPHDCLTQFLARWWSECDIEFKLSHDDESALLEQVLDSPEVQDCWAGNIDYFLERLEWDRAIGY